MVKHKGSALLTALFIVTLIAIVVTAMSVRIRNAIQETQIFEDSDRLYLAAQAVNIWGIDRITDPKEQLNKSDAFGVVLVFPTTLQNIYPNVTIKGEIIDLQGHFNLNNLLSEKYQSMFYNLLNTLHIGNTSFDRKNLLEAIVNWVQPPQNSSAHDEWHDKYARQKPTYFPSHMPMYHPSELRLVYGVTAKFYQKLIPFITVLPEETPININTAPRSIITALNPAIKSSDIDHILQTRHYNPYQDMQALAPFINQYHIPDKVLTLESNYFLTIATASTQDMSMQTFVVLKRQKDKSGLWHASILYQSINTF